jgi:hypothetical protein
MTDSREVLVGAPAWCDVDAAACVAARAVAAARASGQPVLVTRLLSAQAWVLGRRQRFVGAAPPGSRVVRRFTLGTAAHVSGRALWHVLALPHAAALAADGTLDNLLNRNVRGFLRGYALAGFPAQYLGRETLAVQRRPVGVLGTNVLEDGAAVIELVIGVNEPAVPRTARVASLRGRGLPAAEPVALAAVDAARAPTARADAGLNGPAAFDGPVGIERLAALVQEGFLRKFECRAAPLALPETQEPARVPDVDDGRFEGVAASCEVPLGVLEVVRAPVVRVYGDFLGSDAWVSKVEQRMEEALRAGVVDASRVFDGLPRLPLEGVRQGDFERLFETLARDAAGEAVPPRGLV